ncbi:hemerythrin domain-containing protein [Vreelandella jeotgali]|uniref:hemerythrin domain-containing protein n=1 Tax=Vreelandella jeotgali TaxID=553386 RepID=UPI00034CFE68|nr:hemerythrin domain-containing protein [Halomonas jeotgali]
MLKQLSLDHANMARMLHVLDLKYRILQQGERPNFHLMREVVDYILAYMEEFAVSLEQGFVERLKTYLPEQADMADQMLADYRKLRPRLEDLSDDIDRVLMDNVLPMDRFAADLKEYLEEHRRYLQQERRELFPLLEQRFDEKDTEAFAQAMPDNADKVVERLQEAYPELCAELEEADVPPLE